LKTTQLCRACDGSGEIARTWTPPRTDQIVEETYTCGLCQPDVVLLRSKQVGTLPPKPQVEQMRLV
jgi:hypothetical protein